MLDLNHYVGPLGSPRRLPDVAAKLDTPLETIGGTHVSLTGAYTRDRFGFKRSWTWTYDGLTVRQAQYVEALGRGMVRGPLYLIDPRRPNRLPEQIASGGSVRGTTEGFVPGNTAICYWRPLAYISGADLETLPPAPLIRGAIELQTLTTAVVDVAVRDTNTGTKMRIPVMPGETLRGCLWATGSRAAECIVNFRQYAMTGEYVPPAGSSGWLFTSPDQWTKFETPAFVIEPTVAWVEITLTQNNASVGSTYLTGLQLAADDPETVPGLEDLCGADEADPYDGWRLGGGAPQVVADGGGGSYPAPGLTSTALTLTERL